MEHKYLLEWFSASESAWVLCLQLLFPLSLLYIFILVLASRRLKSKKVPGPDTGILAIAVLAVSLSVVLQHVQSLEFLPAFLLFCFIFCIHSAVHTILIGKQNNADIPRGNVVLLIEDGKLNLTGMKKTGICRSTLFYTLGNSGIQQLGEVKRLYLEANNSFLIMKACPSVPGLPVRVEDTDSSLLCGKLVCSNCGELHPGGRLTDRPCPRCYRTCWVEALQSW